MAVASFVVIFKTGKCGRFAELEHASQLQGAVGVLLWDSSGEEEGEGGEGREGAGGVLPEFNFDIGYDYSPEDERMFNRELGLRLAVLQISRNSHSALLRLAGGSGEEDQEDEGRGRGGSDRLLPTTVTFTRDDAISHTWATIRSLLNPTAWPSSKTQRKRLLSKLLKDHRQQHPGSSAVLKEAFERAEVFWSELGQAKARGEDEEEDEDFSSEGGREPLTQRREAGKEAERTPPLATSTGWERSPADEGFDRREQVLEIDKRRRVAQQAGSAATTGAGGNNGKRGRDEL